MAPDAAARAERRRLEHDRADCGAPGPNVHCGCARHREWRRGNPQHPDVVADRAGVIAWMREHPSRSPATGRPIAHPDDYLIEAYGSGLTDDEAGQLGLVR